MEPQKSSSKAFLSTNAFRYTLTYNYPYLYTICYTLTYNNNTVTLRITYRWGEPPCYYNRL